LIYSVKAPGSIRHGPQIWHAFDQGAVYCEKWV
jgi:hypothetical protein